VGVRHDFIAAGRFAFRRSLNRSDEERENPWQLLEGEQRDEAIPVIADANSMQYVLHRSLGDDIVINHGGRPVTLRLVAALSDSIFQGELLMSEANFLKLFPEQEGYQFLLVSASPPQAQEIAATIEDRLADRGADASLTAERLAEFHRVENTYLSTFQTLGGLGLLLGTIGPAERARAPPRAGAARGDWIRPLPAVRHRDRRKHLPARVRAGGGRGVRAGGHRASRG
jgi:hypothetical protein